MNFVIEGEQITLRRPKYTLETAYASVPPLPSGKDMDEAIREAKEDRAERLIEKMGKGRAADPRRQRVHPILDGR